MDYDKLKQSAKEIHETIDNFKNTPPNITEITRILARMMETHLETVKTIELILERLKKLEKIGTAKFQ